MKKQFIFSFCFSDASAKERQNGDKVIFKANVSTIVFSVHFDYFK